MEGDRGSVSRRRLLGLLGAAGGSGLAGCSELAGGGSTTATDPADGTDGGGDRPSIDVEVSTEDGADTQVIRVTGVATAPSGVDAVVLEAGKDRRRIEAQGAPQYRVDADLHVEGGRSYEVRAAVLGRDGTTTTETIDTDHVPIYVDPIETDRLVGAHYYPWYEAGGNWTDMTPSTPTLGEYDSDDPAVIDRHLKWCLEHGVRWLSMSWWGPGSETDWTLENRLLGTDRFNDIEFSILYETVGRLEEFDYNLDGAAARNRLRDDLGYLEETYFGRENYLHLDGRPVVFFFLAQNFQGDVPGAFEAVTRDLETEPYVLAGVPFGSPPDTHSITRVADAVTSYIAYPGGSDVEEVFHEFYRHGNEVMHLGAETAGVGYVPVAIPGYNDTEIPDYQREDHPVLAASPERYEQVCTDVAPHLEDAEAVLVTSFNEWFENTAIEPNETYGAEYLKLTADRLATGSSPGFEASGPRMRLEFDVTVVPAEVNPDDPDTRELAFMAGGLRLLDGGDELRAYDIGDPEAEPLFLGGVFGPESRGGGSWRWFGGASGATTIQFDEDAADADRAVLVGQPMVSDEIEADVVVDGTTTDHVAFGARTGRFDEYELSLSP